MIAFSIALVIIAIIFTVKPPQITIHRTHTLIETPSLNPNVGSVPEDPEKMDELMRNSPPSLDKVVQKMNEVLFEIGGEDDN